ncbi:MAG: 3-deoxy-manno-octulosonate cytidylyltransferase [Gammaproteobacteria bacterium]|nr:3-deoxy-manno-octulosonate cytidylyltransferase [Gammaproteobacteria bacterium]
MDNPFHIIIPSRYASTRLPGKALTDIAGKPMIQRVIEQCQQSDASSVIVATDDERIAEIANQSEAISVMTSHRHRSGSERVAEAAGILGLDDHEVIVNVQGDEPGIPPSLVNQVAHVLPESGLWVMSTAVTPIQSESEMIESSVVKAVVNAAGEALYFSRAPIPFDRNRSGLNLACAKRHIGIYGYRAGFIRDYAKMNPCPLEELEQLEQLRVLWHGGKIKCVQADDLPPTGIDTEQDLKVFRSHFSSK